MFIRTCLLIRQFQSLSNWFRDSRAASTGRPSDWPGTLAEMTQETGDRTSRDLPERDEVLSFG